MSLSHFQRALSAMTVEPHLAATVRRRGANALAAFDLTERERDRLVAVSRQPGMDLNCTLARSNRFAPIYDAFPLTCTLLGTQLREVLDELWRSAHPTNYQLSGEIDAFAKLLTAKLTGGEIANPYLPDILGYEAVCWELAQSLRHEPPSSVARQKSVAFRYDPSALLPALEAGRIPLPQELPQGRFRVCIILRGDELIVMPDDTIETVTLSLTAARNADSLA
jgi:hypothetical protein